MLSSTEIGLVGLVALFALLAIRMPIGMVMMIVGAAGIWATQGLNAAIATLRNQPLLVASNSEFMVIPLFLLMGNLATMSGMSQDLYRSAHAWIGHWRGGLASATIAGCAGFAALSGSSVACAVTMGRVALPEMLRYKYKGRLATGAIAAGGTLGILIPPSTGFILYAILTEESIGRLFLAGIFPGILLTALFIGAISLVTWVDPLLGPPGPKMPYAERWSASVGALPTVAIILITIGGIYTGIFTVVEAAGIGAFLALGLTIIRKRLTIEILRTACMQTVTTTAFVFFILVGASVFTPFVALTGIPNTLAEGLQALNLPATGSLIVILLSYLVLGCFLEGFAMLVLTLPIVHPMIVDLGYSPIWFGVLMVLMLELSLISPPVGINVFVVKSIAGDIPMSEIFRGVFPFVLAMIVCIALLMIFPQIALFLPNSMN